MRDGETMMATTFAPDTGKLRRISESSSSAALPQAAHFLTRLVRAPGFQRREILPLLDEAKAGKRWYVARRYDDEGGSYSLQIFVWPPGSRTQIHDHASWGAYSAAAGTLLEERYERLDDGSIASYARLKKVWGLAWNIDDGASTVLPGDAGIHRVGNPGGEVAVSVHLYGPRLGEADGRDYDPSREYVCDRWE